VQRRNPASNAATSVACETPATGALSHLTAGYFSDPTTVDAKHWTQQFRS
jgi:hypothetical protein